MANVVIENPADGMITGRNGTFEIIGVSIWDGQGKCFIDGIGKRGNTIKGGLMLPSKDMDELAFKWLEERGYVLSVRPDV